jgi:hypothetical protein
MAGGFAFAVSPIWRTLFWVSFAAWILIELAIWSRDRAQVKGRREDRFSMLAYRHFDRPRQQPRLQRGQGFQPHRSPRRRKRSPPPGSC